MADGGEDAAKSVLSARTLAAINDVDADEWDALARADGDAYNPFVSHKFLHALEQSKSIDPQTGWMAAHMVLEQGGKLVGAAPLYVKGHSQGEYVFDHHWADAYERAGGRYFPKLVCAAPFTPVTGPRLLAPPEMKFQLASAMMQIADRMNVSSLHVNFTEKDDSAALDAAGFLARRSVQYHWLNRDYESFDGFLAALSSRKRKTIRRERKGATENGLVIKRLRGAEITEDYWNAFWVFYQDTGSRKWGTPYLTCTCFRLFAETMNDELLMFVAERDGEPIAGALNFIGSDTLYGRYWGCSEDHPFLHFELCYYQAIDFAIEHDLARVEAGAQGEHKLARGYEPVETHSAHWIADPNFRTAIANYLQNENTHSKAEADMLKNFTPFKKGE